MKNQNIEQAEKPKELKDCSVLELKAIIYDFNVIIEQNRNNIQLVQQELSKRND